MPAAGSLPKPKRYTTMVPDLFIALWLSGFAALALLRLPAALALIAFLLPTYLIRFTVFGLPATLLEGMLLIAVAAWALHRLVRRDRSSISFPFAAPAIVLFAAATLAVMVAPDLRTALGLWRAYFLEPLLLFIVVVDTAKDDRTRRWLIAALGASTLYLAIWAVLQYVGVVESPGPWIDEVPKRVTSFFDYPNALGLFVTPIAGLFLGLVGSGRLSKRSTMLWLVVVGLSVLSIAGANARGAAIGIGAALVFLGCVSRFKKLVWICLFAVVLVATLIPATRAQLSDILTVRDTSTDVRVVLWQGTWNVIKAKPLLGSGLGGFPTDYEQYRLIKHTEFPLYPHNIALNFWVELGLVGLIAFIWLIALFFRASWRQFRSSNEFESALGLGLTCAMVALIAYGLVEVPYFKNDLAVMFWILLSLLVSNQSVQFRDLDKNRKW